MKQHLASFILQLQDNPEGFSRRWLKYPSIPHGKAECYFSAVKFPYKQAFLLLFVPIKPKEPQTPCFEGFLVFLWNLKAFPFQVRLSAPEFLWRVTGQKIVENRKGKRMRRDNKRHCVWKFTVVVLLHNCSSWGWIFKVWILLWKWNKIVFFLSLCKITALKIIPSEEKKKKKNNRRLFIPPLVEIFYFVL